MASKGAKIVRNDLPSAGFVLNEDKTELEPKTRGRWLGLLIDAQKMEFRVPPEKVKSLQKKLSSIGSKQKTTAKELASLAGTLSSMQHVVGPLVRFQTRAMYAAIARAKFNMIALYCVH